MNSSGVGSENDRGGSENDWTASAIAEISLAKDPCGPKAATKSLTPSPIPLTKRLNTSSGLTSGNSPNGTTTLASGWTAEVNPCAGSP